MSDLNELKQLYWALDRQVKLLRETESILREASNVLTERKDPDLRLEVVRDDLHSLSGGQHVIVEQLIIARDQIATVVTEREKS